jgi:hypothetical protein
MPTFYVDESGFTGQDLLAIDQPIFAMATNDFTRDEAQAIIRSTFPDIGSRELKHARLARSPRHRQGIIELIRIGANDPQRVGVWMAHKEFTMVTMVVERWIEPLAHRTGFNLYKDGGNIAMSNMFYVCLEGYWSAAFRRKVLLHFQRMFRERTQERLAEAEALLRKEMIKVDRARTDVLQYFLPSFAALGLEHLSSLPRHVLDLALPGLALIGGKWRERAAGPWQVVHDNSSNMARQKWLWGALSSPKVAAAHFVGPAGTAIFPMNVNATRFADSSVEPQLQICDIIAGATCAYARSLASRASVDKDQPYREKLGDAGIQKLLLGTIWPSTDVEPEALGTKGWDASPALDWLSEQVGKQVQGSREIES